MNHATLASITAPSWKNANRSWYMPRPPRPGSTSPRLDRRKIAAIPGNQKCESSRTSPKLPHSLQVNQTSLSKSPSAPNLQATSKLALQSSLTGFTVLALGKNPNQITQNQMKIKNAKIKKHHSLSNKQKHEVQIHFEKAEDVVQARDTICEKNASAKFCVPPSPTRRLKAHIVLPTEDENQTYKVDTWIERQQDNKALKRDNDTAPSRIDTDRQKLLLKETRV